MSRWQQATKKTQNHFMIGRIQRQKMRISRNRILESMIKVMDLYGNSKALLEFEFFAQNHFEF